MALRDRQSRLRFIGNECAEAIELLPQLSNDKRTFTIHLIDEDGLHRSGARAIFTIVGVTESRFSVTARLLAYWPFYLVAEPFYRIFAHYRGKFAHFFEE